MLLSTARQTVTVLVAHLQQLSDSNDIFYDIDTMESLLRAVYLPACMRHQKTRYLSQCIENDLSEGVLTLCQSVYFKPIFNATFKAGNTLLEEVLVKDRIEKIHVDMVENLLHAGCMPHRTVPGRPSPLRLNIYRQSLFRGQEHLYRDKISVALIVRGGFVDFSDAALALRKGGFLMCSHLNLSGYAAQFLDACISGLVSLARVCVTMCQDTPQIYDLFVKIGIRLTKHLCHKLQDEDDDVCPSLIDLVSLPDHMLSYLGDEIDEVFPLLLQRSKGMLMTYVGSRYPTSLCEALVFSGNISWFMTVTTYISETVEKGRLFLSCQQNPVTGQTLPNCITLSPLDYHTKKMMLDHLKRLSVYMHGKDRLGFSPLMHACSMPRIVGVNHPLELMEFFLGCNDTTPADHQGIADGVAVTPMSLVLYSNVGNDLVNKVLLLESKGFKEVLSKDYFLYTTIFKCVYTRDMGTLEALSDMFNFDKPDSSRLHHLLLGPFQMVKDQHALKRFMKNMGLDVNKIYDAIATDESRRQTTAISI